MSEYQYYEFQTVDRLLSQKEMAELRGYSTRATITPASFSNEYSFGSFKGNQDLWMEKYFDAFLYTANWGTNMFQIALPAGVIETETASLYCSGNSASVREKSGKCILSFYSESEPVGWVDATGVLPSLLPLRTELANGDLRCLYLGWLLNAQARQLAEDEVEPPVPPNLGQLSGSLAQLVEFLRIDRDLLAVAAESSPTTRVPSAHAEEMAAWIARLPVQDKDALLLRLLEGEAGQVATRLRAQFNRDRAVGAPLAEAPRRTAGQLLSATEVFRERRLKEEARKAAEEKARQERLAAIARAKHLNALSGKEPTLWATIEELIATKLPKNYDLAKLHLVDLRDLAVRKGEQSQFSRRLAALREKHSRKPSLIERLRL